MRYLSILVGMVVMITGVIISANPINEEHNNNPMNDCIYCHTDESQSGHFIESSNDCQFCHIVNPNSDNHQVLSMKDNATCLSCHVKQDILNSNVSHDELYCVDCHNPHGSENDYMFNNTTVTLCNETCHTKTELGISHPVGGNLVDKRTGSKMTCISTCHSLHSPKESKLLQFANDGICLQCHGEL